eukprot:148511-Hanusia_phi.AAC.1
MAGGGEEELGAGRRRRGKGGVGCSERSVRGTLIHIAMNVFRHATKWRDLASGCLPEQKLTCQG